MRKSLLVILLFLVNSNLLAQRVGVVLSGGGATGFAHIGVLKALEDYNIPIDYITGTSAGALVGGLYASGFSPWEIEQLVLSESFTKISEGTMEEDYKYYIHQTDQNAELMSFRFAKDSIFQKSLPTNLLNPTYLDLEVLRLLGLNPKSAYDSFDSLFIPFRCIASDIVHKESILFSKGPLNQAVRASMTYPFFISPIEVDGKLLFDGGLYNNFPALEMYNEFDPDFIIGSNVSYNEAPPTEDDLMSQIRNMFSEHSDYTLPCESGIIVEPELDEIGTFDFDKIKNAIDEGYRATVAKIDSIYMFVNLRVTKEERAKARQNYKSRKFDFIVSDVSVNGVDPDEERYVQKKLIKRKKGEELTYEELKPRYLNLYQSDHVLSMFPMLELQEDSTYKMNITLRNEKPFKASFGGHYSSRPVNTGFLSLSYNDFKVAPLTLHANAYFGKFYGSVKTSARIYLPTRKTVYVEPMFVMNRWDYFKSLATFFEDVKPSYLVQNEQYWRLNINVPTSNKSKFVFDFANGVNEDDYYQNENFTNADTADFTSFLFYSPGISWTLNSLNRKQFASSGTYFNIRTRFIHGVEHTVPGSTSGMEESIKTFRNWVYVNTSFKTFLVEKGIYRLGLYAEGAYSLQPFFNNFTASLLSSQSFQPIPDAKIGFYNDFHANKFLGGGLINVFTINDKFDFRLEAYIFQPITRIKNDNGMAYESELFEARFGIASASLIYHSIIGPMRVTANYFNSETILKPLTIQFSYGFVIFNESGIK